MAIDIPEHVRRAFFGRFGGRLRPVQQTALKVVESGRDCLIASATGSGKTEAAFVPVAMSILEQMGERRGIGAVVISPTRALASDLFSRLSPVLESLGIRLDVATGDKDSRRPGKATDILIRTPEGLDATLCRHPDDLKEVVDVVIDEVHVFLGSPRGTQLTGLLYRLQTVGRQHRRFGLSATLPDITLPHRARILRDPLIVTEAGNSGMDVIQYRWIGNGARGVDPFLTMLRSHGCRKAIGFARTKARVENLCHILDTGFLRGRCLVHHGSTSSAIRRETETRLRNMQVGLVIATNTLEVGIDVGDVDTCILFDAPPDVSSLLQRAGRAGRRGGLRRVIYVAELYDRATDFARLLSKVRAPVSGGPADARPFLSGCLQQAASLVASYGSCSRASVEEFLSLSYGLAPQIGRAMIKCLANGEVLNERGGELGLGVRGTKMLEDRSIHLTFGGDSGTPVVDELSGRRIGRTAACGQARIRLGGLGRQVVGVDRRTGEVISVPAAGGTALFAPVGVCAFERLAMQCRSRMGPDVRG